MLADKALVGSKAVAKKRKTSLRIVNVTQDSKDQRSVVGPSHECHTISLS